MNQSIKTGTATGTLISVFCSISWIEIEKTLVLGAIGAAVSFLVSYGLKCILSRKRKT